MGGDRHGERACFEHLRGAHFAMLRRMQREFGRLFELMSFEAHMAATNDYTSDLSSFVDAFLLELVSGSESLPIRVNMALRRGDEEYRAFHLCTGGCVAPSSFEDYET